MTTDVTTVAAPAKLTRRLRVLGVRDDGYHLLDAEMASLDLADELTFDPRSDGVTVEGPFADGVPGGEANLVARAMAAVGRRAGVRIVKRIPHGAGLGGGSADAAAVLRWAGVADLRVATALGADVAFCLLGGRARVTGIGDVVEPLAFEPLAVTIVVPPLTVSTPAVYRAWDELGGPAGDHGNDLEPAALVVEPALHGWRDRIAALVAERPVLAGSGSAWFVIGDRERELAPLRGAGALVVAARATRPW